MFERKKKTLPTASPHGRANASSNELNMESVPFTKIKHFIMDGLHSIFQLLQLQFQALKTTTRKMHQVKCIYLLSTT